jgi:hypothetical protein
VFHRSGTGQAARLSADSYRKHPRGERDSEPPGAGCSRANGLVVPYAQESDHHLGTKAREFGVRGRE